MRKQSIIALTVTAFIGTAAIAQPKLVEKVSKKGSELVIPYEKYVYPNGLTLLVHEDHSDPVVHVDVTYHVGSAREQIGRSGFAHFFEHMMFQGSDNVADEEHFKIVSESGGTLNGTTNSDRTNYFETMPVNQLETALWLESDRMGFLLDAVTQKKFEVQRSTVKNERGQNYDNRPYGLVYEKTNRALYPYGHPYSWPTIGYIEDLDRVDVNDLKKFFLRWYGPNNAVVTVAGDVKAQDVANLVDKYFGSIPRGPEVNAQPKTPVKIDSDRYISYEDNIKFPLIQFAFPGVPNRHPDEAPLDILADILGGNKKSFIYQNLVKTQKAIQASASNPCAELAGIFTINALPFPGNTLPEMEKLIRQSIEEFEKTGFSDEDLNRFKASYESHLVNSLASVSGKASQLAAFQTYTANANYIKEELDRYLRVSREDVMRVFNTYIKNKPAVILSVVPKGKPEMVAQPDNYQFPAINPKDADDKEYKELVYNKAVDKFDRTKRPTVGSAPTVPVPQLWKESFQNGLKVLGTQSNEVPMVTMQLTINGAHRIEEKSKAGISQLLVALMDESTVNYTAEQMSDELAKLGSTIDIKSGNQEITVTITSLKKNMDKTLKLAEEILFKPKFDQVEFEMVKNQQLQNISNQLTQPTVIANNVYNKLLYGESSIMAVPVIGTTATVSSITIEDVKQFYNKNFSPNVSNLIVVGDINKEEAIAKTAFLKSWANKSVVLPKETATAPISKTQIFLVNKEKAPQSEIRIGYMSMPYDATGDFYKSHLMNFALGGAFNSRINLNLREDKGYTYGASSGFKGTTYNGPFTAHAGVRGDATDSALVEFIKEIKQYAEKGITKEELEFTKNSIGQSDALKYETPVQKAAFIKRIVDYNLDPNYVKKQNEILTKITKEEIDAIAKKNLPLDKMAILIVGDKALVSDGLKKLGYEIIELDLEGKIVEAGSKEIYPKK